MKNTKSLLATCCCPIGADKLFLLVKKQKRQRKDGLEYTYIKEGSEKKHQRTFLALQSSKITNGHDSESTTTEWSANASYLMAKAILCLQ